MSSRDLATVVKTQKGFIKELLDKLISIPEKSSRILIGGKKFYDIADVQTALNDRYFIGLSLEQILELAKKSIRLTDDNCKLRHKLEDIKTFASMYNNDPLFKQVLDIIGEDIQELQ